jgi:hypothetical protein
MPKRLATTLAMAFSGHHKVMKKQLIPLILITGLLAGCFDKPMNFSCAYTDAPKVVNSLSLKNNTATLSEQVFKEKCSSSGNLSIYGSEKIDCEGYRRGTSYSVFTFDNVIFKARTINKNGETFFSEYFLCKKMD